MKFSLSTGCHYPDDIAYPEGAIPADAIDVTQEQFNRAMHRGAGETLDVRRGKQVIIPAPEPDADAQRLAAFAALRAERNRLLAASDFTQLPDIPLSAEHRAAWATYRQALRDLPETATDPDKPTWPAAPEA